MKGEFGILNDVREMVNSLPDADFLDSKKGEELGIPSPLRLRRVREGLRVINNWQGPFDILYELLYDNLHFGVWSQNKLRMKFPPPYLGTDEAGLWSASGRLIAELKVRNLIEFNSGKEFSFKIDDRSLASTWEFCAQMARKAGESSGVIDAIRGAASQYRKG